MTRFDLLRLHRRLSLWAAIAVLIWACSGLLHPVMTWTSPQPTSFMPPPAQVFAPPTLAQVKTALGSTASVTHLRIMPQGILADGRFFNAGTGREIPDGELEHAVSLARHYTGSTADVTEAARITAFDHVYTYINRFLPAWRIALADGRTVYVDTDTDRLGAITDQRKVVLQTLFETLHTFKFLDGAEPLRLAVIASLVGIVPVMAVLGIVLQFAIRRPRVQGPRRWHRWLGALVGLPLLAFACSGLFHLVMQSPLLYAATPDAPNIPLAAISRMPQAEAVDDLRLVADASNRPWWRIAIGPNVFYMDGGNGESVTGEEAFARHLATGWGMAHIETATLQPTFSTEYGFANKRLPVWRLDSGDGQVMFIEPRTGTLAARVNAAGAGENWVFSNIHKWAFATNRIARDAVMVLVILMAIGTVIAGLRLRR